MNCGLISIPESILWVITNLIVKDSWLIPLGVICLAVALVIDHFLPEDNILSFLMGILIGLSITLNLVGLHRSRN